MNAVRDMQESAMYDSSPHGGYAACANSRLRSRCSRRSPVLAP
jgi:hypothetical protein